MIDLRNTLHTIPLANKLLIDLLQNSSADHLWNKFLEVSIQVAVEFLYIHSSGTVDMRAVKGIGSGVW